MSETDTTIEANPMQDLIQQAINQDFTKANKTFGEIMTIKMNDLLDQEQIRLADQIYNGVEDEEDGQLDLDLDGDDEEVSGESSEDQDPDEEDAGADYETEDGSEEEEEIEEE